MRGWETRRTLPTRRPERLRRELREALERERRLKEEIHNLKEENRDLLEVLLANPPVPP